MHTGGVDSSSTARIVVVGLGPAGPGLVTAGTRDLIDSVHRRWVRTRRHPSASVVGGSAASFDDVYDTAGTFDEVYDTIVARLWADAREHGEVLYAVPGSPRVLERTVELLVAGSSSAGVEVVVEPAMSFLDLAWVRLGVDPVEAGVRLVDGHAIDPSSLDRGPLLVAHCHNRRVLSDLKLSVIDPPDQPVLVLHHLGLADEAVVEVSWDDLDRTVDADHLTSVYVPVAGTTAATELGRLDEVVRALRVGCPWDAEQTHHSLRRYLLEETYELADAIDAFDEHTGEGIDDLEEELGDVLFQVFFHAALAAERGEFTTADVARGIREKLVRRHPHVFGDVVVADADEVVDNWAAIKAAEKSDRASVMDGVAMSMPSLLLAVEVMSKAARLGLGPAELSAGAPSLDQALESAAAGPGAGRAAGAAHEELGGALLAVVARCRLLGIDPEAALRWAVLRARDGVRAVEAEMVAHGIPPASAPQEVRRRWAARRR